MTETKIIMTILIFFPYQQIHFTKTSIMKQTFFQSTILLIFLNVKEKISTPSIILYIVSGIFEDFFVFL